MSIAQTISNKLAVKESSVAAVLDFLAGGHTIPFLARYRKEATGGLDEVQLLSIRDESLRLSELESRKRAILESLQETGSWTEERERAVGAFDNLALLEDFFLPFRPKRRTRAILAQERGYGPAAERLWLNKWDGTSLEELEGAQDIVAERLAETPTLRQALRNRMISEGRLVISKARKSETGHMYADHIGKSELLAKMPGYRLLAVLRGESEKHLSLSVEIGPEDAYREIVRIAFGAQSRPIKELENAVRDSWKRLLGPSLENEVLKEARGRAEQGAIRVFAENLRQLLLAAPLGQKSILAVDPGFRTGCKVVVLSAQGSLLEHSVIYPLEPQKKAAEASLWVRQVVSRHRLSAVAVGNGTGGREAEGWLKTLELGIPVLSISEAGASVYSASAIARQEFPNHDLTVRGAVSIGRRLMDPLAELVKIDPKSIGVGQYQHDVDQKELQRSLEDVVVSCVNRVGVEVNTATVPILTYVAGLNERLATEIVEHRTRRGPYRSRRELLEVKGLGPKAFEQAAGFLRIRNGLHPLDSSAVHPESYEVVERMARRAGCSVAEILGAPERVRKSAGKASDWGMGEDSWADLVAELQRPGRDPREAFEVTVFDDAVRSLDDLHEGLVLTGIVTNVTDFGAFVDIGVHQDGLVHVSHLANTFVKSPLDVVRPGQTVKVMVLSVDVEKKRISLSRKACL